MPALLKKDLKEKYKWTTSEGDDAHLIHDDAKHLSRDEGYEMLLFLNKLGLQNGIFVYGTGSDLTKEGRQKIEWMLKNHFESTAPGRYTVLAWINAHFAALSKKYPH